MMKRFLCTLLAAVWLGGGLLSAQEVLEVKRVELDELMQVLRTQYPGEIYYVKDAAEQSTFTVSAPAGKPLWKRRSKPCRRKAT